MNDTITRYKNVDAIRRAVVDGVVVYWKTSLYTVKTSSTRFFYIECSDNNNTIGLTGLEGTVYENVLNGEINDFYS